MLRWEASMKESSRFVTVETLWFGWWWIFTRKSFPTDVAVSRPSMWRGVPVVSAWKEVVMVGALKGEGKIKSSITLRLSCRELLLLLWYRERLNIKEEKGGKKTYVIVFLVCSRLQGRDPFFHFATGLCAEDERTERSDDLYFVQESINKQ